MPIMSSYVAHVRRTMTLISTASFLCFHTENHLNYHSITANLAYVLLVVIGVTASRLRACSTPNRILCGQGVLRTICSQHRAAPPTVLAVFTCSIPYLRSTASGKSAQHKPKHREKKKNHTSPYNINYLKFLLRNHLSSLH